jgi:hypothetical protein
MGRYRYSLVRCVPEPWTGEFINVGAIAGSADEGDWATRQIGNLQRASKLCAAEQLGAVVSFIAQAARQIDDAEDSLYPLPDAWLDDIASERRNVVQLSEPRLAVGTSANDVLDRVFARQLIDPAKVSREFISKTRLLARIKRQIRDEIPEELFVERPVLTVGGGHVTAQIDCAFGTNRAVQLTQAWSFQKETVDDLARDVKAWGYALTRLRDGGDSRLEGVGKSLIVGPDVPIEVMYAAPTTARQREVFEEASEVFDLLKVTRYNEAEAPRLVSNVADLLKAV